MILLYRDRELYNCIVLYKKRKIEINKYKI